MKKITKLTENELVQIVKKVLAEQNMIDGFSQKENPRPSGNVNISSDSAIPKHGEQSTATISSKSGSVNPEEWYKNFPCLKGMKRVNGLAVYNGMVLLPVSGFDDPRYDEVRAHGANQNYVGKVKTGGVYFCSAVDSRGLVILPGKM